MSLACLDHKASNRLTLGTLNKTSTYNNNFQLSVPGRYCCRTNYPVGGRGDDVQQRKTCEMKSSPFTTKLRTRTIGYIGQLIADRRPGGIADRGQGRRGAARAERIALAARAFVLTFTRIAIGLISGNLGGFQSGLKPYRW